MKLCTFQTGDLPEVGWVQGDLIVPVQRVLPQLLSPHQPMMDLVARWGTVQPVLKGLQTGSSSAALAPAMLRRDQVKLLAPIPRPGKVLGIGLNYVEHVNEKIIGESRSVPEHQIWFTKLATAINGPYDPIELPDEAVSRMVDYEAELVVIIGQRCKHVSRERAPEVVFGYCVGNDVSVRDWQKRTSQWTLGKSFDTHAPFGPWITTADELPEPHGLDMRCWINGELRQNSNTRLMIHQVWDQIALLSTVMTLEPGDVIYTGTCSGVGAAFDPPKFLRVGDQVKIEIDTLGMIEARCVAEPTGAD